MTTRQIVISEQHQKIQLRENLIFKRIKVLNCRFDNPYTSKNTMQISFSNGLDQNEMIMEDGSRISYFYSFPEISSSIDYSEKFFL